MTPELSDFYQLVGRLRAEGLDEAQAYHQADEVLENGNNSKERTMTTTIRRQVRASEVEAIIKQCRNFNTELFDKYVTVAMLDTLYSIPPVLWIVYLMEKIFLLLKESNGRVPTAQQVAQFRACARKVENEAEFMKLVDEWNPIRLSENARLRARIAELEQRLKVVEENKQCFDDQRCQEEERTR